MVVNRAEGLAKASLYSVLLLNTLAFLIFTGIVSSIAIQWFGISRGTFTYLFAVFIAVFYSSRQIVSKLSQIETIYWTEAIALALRIQVGFVIGASFIYFLKEDLDSSRLFLGLFFLLLLPLNTLALIWIPKLLASKFYPNHVKSKSIIICPEGMDEELKSYVRSCQEFGIIFLGYIADRKCEDSDIPLIGDLDEVMRLRAQGMVFDSILVWGGEFHGTKNGELIAFCHDEGIRFQIHAKFASSIVEPVKIIQDKHRNFIAFPNEPLEDPLHRGLKRFMDLAVSIPICIFLLAPMTLLVWFFQRIQSPGPLLYKQVRYGINRVPFEIIKFRSMDVGGSQDLFDEARQAVRDDPRIYSFGKFLRKVSLDEFPQFWNVLKGEMSIVGPRPHPVKLDEALEKEYSAYRSRHFVKPGITGLAQVNGMRGEINTPEQLHKRIRLDLEYIYNWNLSTDLVIILRTVGHLVTPPDSAY